MYIHLILSYIIGANILKSLRCAVLCCSMFLVTALLLTNCSCWKLESAELSRPLHRPPPRPAPWWWRSCQCSSLLNWGTPHTSHSTPAWPGLMCHEWNIQCRLVFISNLTYYIAFSYLLVSGEVCLFCNSKQRLTIHYCTLIYSKL